MQDIKNLTTQFQQRLSGPSRSETHDDKRRALGLPMEQPLMGNLNESHFDRLWLRMGQTFGHAWFTAYGAEPSAAWIDGLSDMTVEDIQFALGALKGWKSDFPPNLLQFRALCKPVVEVAHKIYRRLPEPEEVTERRRAAGRIHVEKIREILETNQNQG